jgi:zinc/manganese transport system permease protein
VVAVSLVPALATSATARSRRAFVAYAIGAVGYALGLVLSALFDLPSGAVIVWTLAACGIAWRLLTERRGARALQPAAAQRGEGHRPLT